MMLGSSSGLLRSIVPVRRIFSSGRSQAKKKNFRIRSAQAVAGSPEHKCPPALHGHSRAPPGVWNNDSSPPPLAARAHGNHNTGGSGIWSLTLPQRRVPSCCQRPATIMNVGLARLAPRRNPKSLRVNSVASTSASFRRRNRPDRMSSTSAIAVRDQLISSSGLCEPKTHLWPTHWFEPRRKRQSSLPTACRC